MYTSFHGIHVTYYIKFKLLYKNCNNFFFLTFVIHQVPPLEKAFVLAFDDSDVTVTRIIHI